jgi:hypothetical protein
MPLSSDGGLLAGEPERTLLLERETLILLDASVKSHAKRAGLVLEV